LQFLGDAARASSYHAAHAGGEEQETEEHKQQLAVEREYVRQTREAIWSGLDLYLDLLTDLDKGVRIIAPYTLGLLIGFAQEELPQAIRRRNPSRSIATRLIRQLEEEPNELVQASVIFGLGYLAPYRAEARRLLQRQVKGRSASKRIRFSAALSLSAGDTKLSAAVLDVLLEALRDSEETNHLFDADEAGMEAKHHPLAKAYRRAGRPLSENAGTGFDPSDVGKDEDVQFPWLEGWTTFTVLDRMSRPDADYLDKVMPIVMPYLDEANPYAADSVVGPILRLVFADAKVTRKTRRKDLTPAQIEALTHLYDNLKLWATDIGNVACTFSEFGLPSERKDWKRFLGIKEKPLTPVRIEEMLAAIVQGEGPKVKRLMLCEIGTGAFLPHLKQYRDLERLDLSGVPLCDADLYHLTGLTKLRTLHLPNTALTDVGVETLTALKELRELNLSCTRITDAGLVALKKLPKLKCLMLWEVRVSEGALAQFQKARPRCQLLR
jgi:hypothetical protein